MFLFQIKTLIDVTKEVECQGGLRELSNWRKPSKFLLILESSLEKDYDQVWASKYTIITSYAKMKVACSKRFGPPQILLPPTLTTTALSRLEFSEIYRKHFSSLQS